MTTGSVVVHNCPCTDKSRKHGEKEHDYAWKAAKDTERRCQPNLTLSFELGPTLQADGGLAPVFPSIDALVGIPVHWADVDTASSLAALPVNLADIEGRLVADYMSSFGVL